MGLAALEWGLLSAKSQSSNTSLATVSASPEPTDPKVMVVNEMAGSGGDLMPYMFRRRRIGQLVGTRTWGGLVHTADTPPFIDGGTMIAPRGGFFTRDGKWAVENEGVAPDIEVENWPKDVIAGRERGAAAASHGQRGGGQCGQWLRSTASTSGRHDRERSIPPAPNARPSVEQLAEQTGVHGALGLVDEEQLEQVDDDLLGLDGMDKPLAAQLARANVRTRDDLADLAVDELVEIAGIDAARATSLITTARAHWFE